MGKYDEGLIVYSYFIDYDSIELSKKTADKIVFSGVEKHEETPINVTLRSQKSIDYIYPLIDDLPLQD